MEYSSPHVRRDATPMILKDKVLTYTDPSIPPHLKVFPEAVALAVFALPSVLLLIMPFIWHLRARNIAACSLIAYICYANFVTFLNAILWPNEDYYNWYLGHGLCDIESQLYFPISTGIACSTCCITRNLARVLDVDNAVLTVSKSTKRRRYLIDSLICFGLPIFQIAIHYVFQPNRYYIEAITGCLPTVSDTWPYLVFWLIWPPIVSIINCIYAGCVIIRLKRYKAQFSTILSNSSSGLTTARYLRLFLMSLSILLVYFPVSIYLFVKNVNVEWIAYSWDDNHDYPAWYWIIFLPKSYLADQQWIGIVMAVLVFVFFGMGDDAMDIYRSWAVKIGLARIWPSLREPRKPKKGGLLHKFNLVDKVKSMLNISSSGSQGTSDSNFRKSSVNTSTTDGSETGCNSYRPSTASPLIGDESTSRSYLNRHNIFRTHVQLPPLQLSALFSRNRSQPANDVELAQGNGSETQRWADGQATQQTCAMGQNAGLSSQGLSPHNRASTAPNKDIVDVIAAETTKR